jgi:hypothetical protein
MLHQVSDFAGLFSFEVEKLGGFLQFTARTEVSLVCFDLRQMSLPQISILLCRLIQGHVGAAFDVAIQWIEGLNAHFF